MAAIPHGADADGTWVAACTAPDVCLVGGTPTPFDTSAMLSAWDATNPETNIRTRGLQVYREGDMIAGVLGNAGSGLPSGTSLGSGHVLLLPPSPPNHVYGMGREFIVNENQCMVNTNPAGVGGAPGQIYTDLNSIYGAANDATTHASRAVTATEMRLTDTRYRNPNGQFMSREGLRNLPMHERAGAVQRVARPGSGAAVRNLGRAGRVLGPLGTGLTAAEAATDQLGRDAGRTDLTAADRAGRATTRATLEAGGSAAGGAGGAAVGAAIGVWFFGWGAIPGAIIGGLVGGTAGGAAGEYAADQILEPPAPRARMSGAARRAARHGRGRAGS